MSIGPDEFITLEGSYRLVRHLQHPEYLPTLNSSTPPFPINPTRASIQSLAIVHPLRGILKLEQINEGAGANEGGLYPSTLSSAASSNRTDGSDDNLKPPTGSEEKEGKRRRPKNSMAKTNSHFLSRTVVQPLLTSTANGETLAVLIADPSHLSPSTSPSTPGETIPSSTPPARTAPSPSGHPEHRGSKGSLRETFTTFHIGRTFICTDLSKTPKEWRFNFGKAFPTVHAINSSTASASGLDVLLGFSTGDLIWIEPFSDRYHRINKQGVMNGSAVTCLRWLPRSGDMFMSAHADGQLLVFHKDRDDGGSGGGESEGRPSTADTAKTSRDTPYGAGAGAGGAEEDGGGLRGSEEEEGSSSTAPARPPVPGMSVTRRRSLVSRATRQNPLSRWRLGRAAITDFHFSPDGRWLAVTSTDGTLKLIDFNDEKLTDVFHGYFGGLSCLAWSPDGRYIITGGQDDLVSVWSFRERRLIARGEGHSSWVTSVAFDPLLCTADRYRFGSVGQDGNLCLWDFSVAALSRVKGHRARRSSVLFSTDIEQISPETIVHPVPPRSICPLIQPISMIQVHDQPVMSVAFTESHILTACVGGHIKLWARPLAGM